MFAYKNNKRKYFLAFGTYVMVLGRKIFDFFLYTIHRNKNRRFSKEKDGRDPPSQHRTVL